MGAGTGLDLHSRPRMLDKIADAMMAGHPPPSRGRTGLWTLISGSLDPRSPRYRHGRGAEGLTTMQARNHPRTAGAKSWGRL